MGAQQETLGVQSRRESGQSPLPAAVFAWTASPCGWPCPPPAVPLPSLPRPGAPIAALQPRPRPAAGTSQRRDLLEKGTKPSPRGEPGGRFVLVRPSPGTGQDLRRCQVESPEPRSGRCTCKCTACHHHGRAQAQGGWR